MQQRGMWQKVAMTGCIRWMSEIHCGRCWHWVQLPDAEGLGKRETKTFATGLGWRCLRNEGWVCPDCFKKANEADSPH